jgi:uncharacterized protein (PEP-CTERM system associated)
MSSYRLLRRSRFAVRADACALRGAAALGAITYIDGTQNSSIDPVGRFTANIEAIEKWFYVDSDLSATRSVINPLAARPDGPSSFNQQTNLTARLSPYVDRTFSNDVRLLIRSDNAWTDIRRDGEQAPTEYSARHFFSVSRAPRPLGLAIEAERRRDDRIDAGSDTAAWYDLARIRVGWLLGSQLEVGARGGYERSELSSRTVPSASGELNWPGGRPSARVSRASGKTDLSAMLRACHLAIGRQGSPGTCALRGT